MEAILAEAATWPGVTRAPLPDGGVELRHAGRPFARVAAGGSVEPLVHPRVRAMLVETGRLPARDEAEALELLRLAHERARVGEHVRAARG